MGGDSGPQGFMFLSCCSVPHPRVPASTLPPLASSHLPLPPHPPCLHFLPLPLHPYLPAPTSPPLLLLLPSLHPPHTHPIPGQLIHLPRRAGVGRGGRRHAGVFCDLCRRRLPGRRQLQRLGWECVHEEWPPAMTAPDPRPLSSKSRMLLLFFPSISFSKVANSRGLLLSRSSSPEPSPGSGLTGIKLNMTKLSIPVDAPRT